MRRLFRSGSAGGGGLSTAALAPMVDMLTILLVVILRSYSTDPPLEMAEPGFSLPVSPEESPVLRGVHIDIGKSGLYVNGERAGSVEYWTKNDGLLVTEVHELLQQRRGQRALIRAHQDTPWALVGKVLYTAQQAGYEDVQLVAVSRASL